MGGGDNLLSSLLIIVVTAIAITIVVIVVIILVIIKFTIIMLRIAEKRLWLALWIYVVVMVFPLLMGVTTKMTFWQTFWCSHCTAMCALNSSTLTNYISYTGSAPYRVSLVWRDIERLREPALWSRLARSAEASKSSTSIISKCPNVQASDEQQWMWLLMMAKCYWVIFERFPAIAVNTSEEAQTVSTHPQRALSLVNHACNTLQYQWQCNTIQCQWQWTPLKRLQLSPRWPTHPQCASLAHGKRWSANQLIPVRLFATCIALHCQVLLSIALYCHIFPLTIS